MNSAHEKTESAGDTAVFLFATQEERGKQSQTNGDSCRIDWLIRDDVDSLLAQSLLILIGCMQHLGGRET